MRIAYFWAGNLWLVVAAALHLGGVEYASGAVRFFGAETSIGAGPYSGLITVSILLSVTFFACSWFCRRESQTT